jgi:hypothetical protein
VQDRHRAPRMLILIGCTTPGYADLRCGRVSHAPGSFGVRRTEEASGGQGGLRVNGRRGWRVGDLGGVTSSSAGPTSGRRTAPVDRPLVRRVTDERPGRRDDPATAGG